MTTDPVAEAQKVLDAWPEQGVAFVDLDVKARRDALTTMIALNRTLLEITNIDSIKQAEELLVQWVADGITGQPRASASEVIRVVGPLLTLAKDQAAALAAKDERVKAAYIEGFNASEHTSMSADTMWEMSDARALLGEKA